ncbi:unnamed protein product [Gongylonema pulchrum]|uniref:RNA-binding protein n=1 Tax=Gongylonema pulchrum TaxID=637853 RepID=A0A183ENX3_9BILA|nr:unnamed protein product [Gongylonema pulchrum]
MDELNPRGAGDSGAGGGYGYGGGSGYGLERTEPRYLASSGRAAAAAAPGSGRSGAWWRNSAGVNDYGNFF